LSIFKGLNESYRNSANIRQHLTVFQSDFNNIYIIYFGILQTLMRNYEILQKFTKVNKSCNIPRYFLCKITHFHSVLFNCNALLEFHDFVPWQMKFFCLLLYSFIFRQHWQIFHHHQTKANLLNITDTYIIEPTWSLVKPGDAIKTHFATSKLTWRKIAVITA